MSQEIGPFEDLRALIVRACNNARARGIKIKHDWGVGGETEDEGKWGREFVSENTLSPCIRPLGAVLLGRPWQKGQDAESAVAEALGVDGDWVAAFLDGYDDMKPGSGTSYQTEEDRVRFQNSDPTLVAAFELGHEIRQIYLRA